MTDFPERGSVSIDIEASAASVWALLGDSAGMTATLANLKAAAEA